MQQADLVVREDVRLQVGGKLSRGAGLEFLVFFNKTANDVGLTALAEHLPQGLIHQRPLVAALPVGLDRLPARRHLINDGDFQIAVDGQRQCAWDRRGRHHQNIGSRAFAFKRGPLHDAKSMLFVHNP